MTVSAGIAMIPYNGYTYKELFKNADKALYSVKMSTKNDYKFTSESEI